uniref:Glutaredoxin domain-containing protein n=1 Tax=Kalanchoe fedtschenkoi TaxID=63787 RepID=A0A7N0U9E8_KALFE
MQGLKRYRSAPNDAVRLQLTTPPSHGNTLAIDVSESADQRIRRLISEHPLVIFARSACYMCYVMKNLLSTIGAHPTVIELEDEEELKALRAVAGGEETPTVFIGGERVGVLESLVALHLSGRLAPKLVQAGAL